MKRVVPDHEPVVCQPAKRLGLLSDRDPLCALDRHQRRKEVGNRASAADPGQKGWNRSDPLAPDRRCKEPPVVTDNKLKILDYSVFDKDLEAGVALDLRDGVYRYISAMHAGEYRIVPDTSSASAEMTAPSSGIRAPCRRPVSARRVF